MLSFLNGICFLAGQEAIQLRQGVEGCNWDSLTSHGSLPADGPQEGSEAGHKLRPQRNGLRAAHQCAAGRCGSNWQVMRRSVILLALVTYKHLGSA
ncbi:hypothetical protein E2C01_048337 [Portunus trituberculatus]|uniref:Uncharacterized protein n=1 Tax=Portunus trituberculatus TaxID=210409 RepID=A0A5B7G3J2_PORTR|nr:hypothetical protein [Portunus trituberculatus]